MEWVLVAILAFALAAFAFEWMPIDHVALVTLGLLIVTGMVRGEEAVAGFSNPAVITVLMMFVLGDSLVRSGIVSRLGHRLLHLSGGSWRRAMVLLLLLTGVVSAFINNTAAVTILIPLCLQLSKHFGTSPAKILLPLSYAAIIGGTCTLVGTSTNLIVSALAAQHGLGAFGVFELLPFGAVLLAVGLVYLTFVGPRLLPGRDDEASLTSKYDLAGFLTEIVVPAGSRLVGRTVVSEQVSDRFRLNVLEILRGKRRIAIDIRHTEIVGEDVLIVRGSPEDLVGFKEHYGLLMLTDTKLSDADIADERNVLAEVQLSPGSALVGQTLQQIGFRRRFGTFVLALQRTGETVREKIAFIRLQGWDTLLVFGPRLRVEALYQQEDFIPLQEHDLALHPGRRWWLKAAIVPAVLLVAAVGLLPIMEASILGVVVMLLGGTLTLRQAYKAVDWGVIFLIAAMIPLGTAMERTGLADRMATGIVWVGGSLGAVAMLSLIYLATSLLTEVVTNNATAILMVPIALQVAEVAGASPLPFLMAVTFAASASFLTPMGYQTNAMVYGPGGYRFRDYLRLGWPLQLTFWVLATLLLPVLWPL